MSGNVKIQLPIATKKNIAEKTGDLVTLVLMGCSFSLFCLLKNNDVKETKSKIY